MQIPLMPYDITNYPIITIHNDGSIIVRKVRVNLYVAFMKILYVYIII